MKFLKVFSLVIFGHMFLIGAFLLQPGCQSIDEQWAEYRREKQNVTVPREVVAQEQGLPVDSKEIDPSFNSGFSSVGQDGRAARVRATPMRPTQSAGMETPAEPLFGTEPSEPLFNPGLEGGFNSGASDFESSPTAGYVPYTVQSGDTLWGLSKEYNVPFAALLEANGMSRDTQLRRGQEILVPSGYGEIVASETTVEAEVVEGTTIYEVRRGDTLSEIAVRSGTSVSRIKNLNNMTSDRIRIGQKLIVPSEITIVEEETTALVEIDPGEFTAIHTVQSGETASGIANRYGMSVTELLAANGIENPRRIRAGSDLKVKPASATSKSATPSASGADSILAPRAPTSLESFNATDDDSDGLSGLIPASEEGPTAPEIVPETEPNPVEPEEFEEGEGFGAEIFDDFDAIEEVPVERRDTVEN